MIAVGGARAENPGRAEDILQDTTPIGKNGGQLASDHQLLDE